MRKVLVAAAVCAVSSLLLSAPVSAGGHHHGHSRANFGFYFGGPMYGSGFYDPWYRPFPPPMYYEPRTVIIEREPPVYIQREPAQPQYQVQPQYQPQPQAQAAAPIWYYCTNPAGYYPHVPRCNQQWVPVDPSTVPQR